MYSPDILKYWPLRWTGVGIAGQGPEEEAGGGQGEQDGGYERCQSQRRHRLEPSDILCEMSFSTSDINLVSPELSSFSSTMSLFCLSQAAISGRGEVSECQY